jgi:hypothetical protein
MKMHKRLGLGVVVAGAMVVGSVTPTQGSSHREAPLTAADPLIDGTDQYAFVSPDDPDTVTLIGNWNGNQRPQAGPNFFFFGEGIQFDFQIDNNGDAEPDIIYRWTFTTEFRNPDTFLHTTGVVESLSDETLNLSETYDLEVIRNGESSIMLEDAPVAPSRVGDAAMPNYEALRDEAISEFGDEGAVDEGALSFAGQADDPFFLDLRIFHLLFGGDLSETGDDTFAGENVQAIALQVPKDALALDGDAEANPIIGVVQTTQRQAMRTQSAEDGSITGEGDFVQVSRLGMPLVNEVVVPIGTKDAFNASRPVDDAQFLPAVEEPEVPMLLEQLYDIPAPEVPRDDLVSVFLTGVEDLNQPPDVVPSEQLRLNMSIPPTENPERLGVLAEDTQGFPNGRRLADDVVDVTLQAAAGALRGVDTSELSDGVLGNDKEFGDTFPYLALPHSGSGTTADDTPAGGVATGAGGTAGSTSSSGLPIAPLAMLLAGVGLAAVGFVRTQRSRVARG